MTFFFLVLGLEAKRELDLGQLRERRRIAIPLAAALGGMALPVLIYLAFNAGGSGRTAGARRCRPTRPSRSACSRWWRPAARGCALRLLTLAVFDDLVALLVIATVYTDHVSVVPLAIAVGLFGVLLALRYAPIAWRGPAAVDRRRGDLGRAATSRGSIRSSPDSRSGSSRARIRRRAPTSSG